MFAYVEPWIWFLFVPKIFEKRKIFIKEELRLKFDPSTKKTLKLKDVCISKIDQVNKGSFQKSINRYV